MLKTLLIVAAAILLVPVTAAVGAALYLATGGFATVELDTPDLAFGLPVPMRFADLAIGLAGLGIDRHPPWGSPEVGVWLEEVPELGELAAVFADCEDGVLVDVQTRDELVRVDKRGSRLRVRVEAPDLSLSVSMPLRALERIAGKAEGLIPLAAGG